MNSYPEVSNGSQRVSRLNYKVLRIINIHIFIIIVIFSIWAFSLLDGDASKKRNFRGKFVRKAKKIFETSSWLYQNWAFIPEGIEIREQKAGGGARKRKKGETERGLNIFLILPAKNEKRSRFEIRMSWLALAFDEAYFFSAFSSWLLTIVTFYLYFFLSCKFRHYFAGMILCTKPFRFPLAI